MAIITSDGIIYFSPPKTSTSVVLNDNVAESIAFFTDQVANLTCSSDQELTFHILVQFNVPGFERETMTGSNCR